jgi:hypothetical protein
VGVGVAVGLVKGERLRRAAHELDSLRKRELDLLRLRALKRARRRTAPSQLQLMTLEQLDAAIALLEGRAGEPPERVVHETRKALKQARALVRLQRDSLGEERFARENAALRDIGRRLAGARDAEVVVETLQAVVKRGPKRLARSPALAELRARLEAERQRTGAGASEGARAQTEALHELHAARLRVSLWTPGTPDRRTARTGLKRIYRQAQRRGRRARKARKTQSSEALHQWRKRTKDLRYATEMLDRFAHSKQPRKRLRSVARRADRLGETLGEEHDLMLLAEQLRAHRRCFKGEKATRRGLERAIAHRRRRLRKRAWRQQERLYRRAPKRFTQRLLTP